MTARAALVLFLAAPLLAVPEHAAVPLPRPKPPRAGITTIAAPIAVPIPRAKPGSVVRPGVILAKPWPANFGSWPASEVRVARAHCRALLATRNLIWRPDNPIGEPGGCGTPAPIA